MLFGLGFIVGIITICVLGIMLIWLERRNDPILRRLGDKK